MPPKRKLSSSESNAPTTRRSLPSRTSRPVRAAMRDGSEEDEVINEVTTTPLEKVIRESMRTARKDFGLKSDDDIPLQLLGPGSSSQPKETPLSEGVVKRKRGRPRKHPLPNDISPSTSKTDQRQEFSKALLREVAATDGDTESDGSGDRQIKARFQRRRNNYTHARSPESGVVHSDKRCYNVSQVSPNKSTPVKEQSNDLSRISSLKRYQINLDNSTVAKLLNEKEPKLPHKKKLAKTRSLAPEFIRKPQCEISEDEEKPVVKGIIKKTLAQSKNKVAKSVTLEAPRRRSNSSDGDRVYPKRNLPQRNYDQIKRRARRKAETDCDASSGFDSDRGSLPNLKTQRTPELNVPKRKSFGSDNSMPVLSAVSPSETPENLPKNSPHGRSKSVKVESPKDSTPVLRRLLSSQVSPCPDKRNIAPTSSPKKNTPSPSKKQEKEAANSSRKVRVSNPKHSAPADKARTSDDSEDTATSKVTKTMTKRLYPMKVQSKAVSSDSSGSEEHIVSRRSHPAINYRQTKKYTPRKSTDSDLKSKDSPQKSTFSKRRSDQDWLSASSAPKAKATDESSSEEEIIPRTTKSRAVPISSHPELRSDQREKSESEKSPSPEEIPRRTRKSLPVKEKVESKSENSDEDEEESEEEERIRPRRHLALIEYSLVKRRKGRRKEESDEEEDSEKSVSEEDEVEQIDRGRVKRRLSATTSTPSKKPRKEPESESEEESSSGDQIKARRSLPPVNYSQTTPRKKLVKRRESEESSDHENLSRKSSEERSEESSNEEETPYSRKRNTSRLEPIFPQRISSESSEKQSSEEEHSKRPRPIQRRKKIIVKSNPRRPRCAVGRNNYFSSSSSEDERFDKKTIQEAQALIKETYEPIMKRNVVEMDSAYKDFQENLLHIEPKEYKTVTRVPAEKFEIPDEEIGDDEVVTRVCTKSGQPTGSAVRVHYISTTATWPRMKHWIYIEHNVKTEDSLRLSHIPYIDDEHDSVAFVRDLKKAYPEGIHGTLQGWGQHISDYLLYQLLKDVVPKWKAAKNETSHLFQAMYKLFPNKLSARQLEQAFPMLEDRFESKARRPREETKKDDVGHSVRTIMCAKCLQYHCLLHGMSGEPFRMHRKAKNRVHVLTPCGEDCYLYLPEVKIEDSSEEEDDSPKIKKKFGKKIKPRPLTKSQGMFNKLVQVDRYTACQITKMISRFEKRTCSEIYHLVEQFVKPDREMSPDDIMIRKLSMKEAQASFRHLTWNLGGGRVDNSEQPHACKHPGACSRKHNNCVCASYETLCSKYCSCGVDCKMRFPGCRCQPGQCRTKQCQCFYAKWECDPDVCKNCNCGPYGGDELGPEKVEIDEDGIDEDASEEELEWLQIEYPPQKPGPEDDINLPSCSNNNLQRGRYKRLRVGKSDIAGYGCFVEDDCEKGEFIAEYTGEVISKWEAERRGRIYDEFKTSYIFALNKEQSVDATRMGNHIRFANHSDREANCYSQIIMVNGEHRIGIFSKRRLYANEELLFDYQYNKKWKAQYCPNERNNEFQGNISSPEPPATSRKSPSSD